MYIVIHVYIYIWYKLIYVFFYLTKYIYIYGLARRPATPPTMLSPPSPPSNHPHWGGQPSTTIRQDLICYTCMLASCHLCTTKQDTSMQCSLLPIQSIYNLFLPIKYLYSSHILATLKISCAIHTCWPRTTHTLSTWYLYNTQPIPQGWCGGKLHPEWRNLQRILAHKVPL